MDSNIRTSLLPRRRWGVFVTFNRPECGNGGGGINIDGDIKNDGGVNGDDGVNAPPDARGT